MTLRPLICFLASAGIACTSSTASDRPRLTLVDGAGASMSSGAIRFIASTAPSSTGDGLTVTLVVRNAGTADTSATVPFCGFGARLYALPGGGLSYSSNTGTPCPAVLVYIVLHPGQEHTFTIDLRDADVAPRIASSRYQVRVGVIDTPSAEVVAGVIER